MTNILLTISYDGTDFCGWQKQKNDCNGNPVRTVQDVIEKALKKMLGKEITIQGSGRTDSGVHASGQAVNFFSPFDSIGPENYLRALNGILPVDVRVMEAKKVSETFSSRFDATSRVYRYFIQTVNTPYAKDSRYVWYIPYRPDVQKLNDMCSCLRGEIDCATFAASGDQSISTNRYIDKAHFWYENDILIFEIEANAFLWKMVRSITGTLIELERKSKTEEFNQILNSRDRSKAGVTAPPTGLFLWKVNFDGIRRHI